MADIHELLLKAQQIMNSYDTEQQNNLTHKDVIDLVKASGITETESSTIAKLLLAPIILARIGYPNIADWTQFPFNSAEENNCYPIRHILYKILNNNSIPEDADDYDIYFLIPSFIHKYILDKNKDSTYSANQDKRLSQSILESINKDASIYENWSYYLVTPSLLARELTVHPDDLHQRCLDLFGN